MEMDSILDAWDNLDRAIQRVLVSQPAMLTENAARLDEERLKFSMAVSAYAKTARRPTDEVSA